MKKFNLGIIGYGGFGQFLHSAWTQNNSVTINTIADIAIQRSTTKGINYYKNFEDLLDNPAIEIVSIATPPGTHSKIACKALHAGKHVILEKPIATTLPDAELILTALKKTNRLLIVNYMLRYHPVIELLKIWTTSNFFGKLRRVTVENYAQDELLPEDHWFWDSNQSGGIQVEHGVHFFDLVHYIASSNPVHINGLSHRRNRKQEDQIVTDILYEDGLIATYYHDFSRPGFFEDTSFGFVFDLAQITLKGWIPLSGQFKVLVNQNTMNELLKLPGLKIKQKSRVKDIIDVSRPHGWGNVSSSKVFDEGIIKSGGHYYEVDALLSGHFTTKEAKEKMYQNLLNDLLTDFIKAIKNTAYQPRITPEDGIASLRIALQAR